MVRIGGHRSRRLATACSAVGVTLVTVLAMSHRTNAQVSFPRGQNIAPVYEGWEQNPDGSFNLVFGYFNRNWNEVIDVPIGPDNTIDPGGPDQGQPTHFFPRRNRFLFRIRVPKDFGTKELVWTLITHGKTERAYATLKPEYFTDNLVIQANTGAAGGGGSADTVANKPPTLKIEGDKTRPATVGQPLTLVAVATDDGLPKPRQLQGLSSNSANGLRLSWFVYRGSGTVTFDPAQITVWEDPRENMNSPWSRGWVPPPVPPGGKWVVRATFSEPGTYVLRALAHDGGLSAAGDVTIIVTSVR